MLAFTIVKAAIDYDFKIDSKNQAVRKVKAAV